MPRNRLPRRRVGNGVPISNASDTAHAALSDEPAAPTAALGKAADVPTPQVALPQPLPEAKSAPATLSAAIHDVVIHIEVIWGGYTNVKVPVAICERYEGMALTGPARAFDLLIDSWLTRAVELGIIGSSLGQLFPVHLQRSRESGRVNVEALLMAGMGEPGNFAADDLRYLMSNVTVAIKSMGHQHLTMTLIGTRRNELSVGQAVHGLLVGILDGCERFRAIADTLTYDRARFLEAADQSLFISLVSNDKEKAERILGALEALRDERSIPGLQLEVARGDDVAPDSLPDAIASDVDPYAPVTLLRVTNSSRASTATAPMASTQVGAPGFEVFEFSGMSDLAAVTVRENEVNAYLVRELPGRMTSASSLDEQEAVAMFFSNYLIPDDFRKLVERSNDLIIEVDENTAALPWEMAAHKKFSKMGFLGTSVSVSRQFRTLLSPAPGCPPPLNRVHKILLIADPAPGKLSLPHAREEGLAVVEVLDQARKAWAGEYEFRVTVRIGSRQNAEELEPLLKSLRQRGAWVVSAEPCDPLKLAVLIVNEHFDVIHYAGHGAFYSKSRRAGWILDQDCFLSAQEIFRVRQVPRLVFANACFSAVTTNQNEQRGQLVGLAQAFFARGIPNYIGTGWQVDDACARECARWFYTRVLGLRRPANDDGVIGTAPPATIGASLLKARQELFEFRKESSSWGAYQHYGRVTDKLLPLPNAMRPLEAD
jgi:CHAT domain